MADWTHETYRRIYQTKDPRWLVLRASTRALAAELIRWVDEDGNIHLRPGEAHWEAIARMIQAGRDESAWVRKATEDLLADGYLLGGEGSVRIKNFRVAQSVTNTREEREQQRAYEAQKKAKQRAAKLAAAERSRKGDTDGTN